MSDLLTPILVAGYGRSGTTALMALLGTDSRVAFDRRYPFENRWLTYLAKSVLVAGRPGASAHVDAVQLNDFSDDRLGPPPWPTTIEDLRPAPVEQLLAMWRSFSAAVRRRHPQATHYAEKAPHWLPAAVRGVLPCRTLHLVRDPRDVFLSARDFSKARGAVGFGMEPGRSAAEQARHTAHGWLSFAENERADRGRDDALLIRYEDWVAAPAAVAERLGTFLGLNLSPEAAAAQHLDGHKTSASVTASVGRWRREPLAPAVQATLIGQLQPFMADYGCEQPTDARPAAQLVPDPSMRCSGDGVLRPADDGAAVAVTGGDFWVELPPAPFRAEALAELWVCVRGGTGDHFSLYWRGPNEPFAEARSVHVPFRPGPHWQVVRLIGVGHRLWVGTIEQVRIDLFNGAVTPGATGEVRWVRLVG